MLKNFPFHEQEIDRRCSLGGYLWKMKKRSPTEFYVPKWTKRWFSIEGAELKWYHSQRSQASSGHISLKFVTHVSKISAQNGIHSFKVESSKQRGLLLRAESRNVLDMWCRAIQMHADLVKGGDGTSVVTKSGVSLNLRVRKDQSLCAKLEETVHQLESMEKDCNSRHSNEEIDYVLDNDCYEIDNSLEYLSDDSEDSIDSLEVKPAESFLNVNQMSWSDKEDDCPQSKEDHRADMRRDPHQQNKRHYSIKEILTRQNPKIYTT